MLNSYLTYSSRQTKLVLELTEVYFKDQFKDPEENTNNRGVVHSLRLTTWEVRETMS